MLDKYNVALVLSARTVTELMSAINNKEYPYFDQAEEIFNNATRHLISDNKDELYYFEKIQFNYLKSPWFFINLLLNKSEEDYLYICVGDDIYDVYVEGDYVNNAFNCRLIQKIEYDF